MLSRPWPRPPVRRRRSIPGCCVAPGVTDPRCLLRPRLLRHYTTICSAPNAPARSAPPKPIRSPTTPRVPRGRPPCLRIPKPSPTNGSQRPRRPRCGPGTRRRRCRRPPLGCECRGRPPQVSSPLVPPYLVPPPLPSEPPAPSPILI